MVPSRPLGREKTIFYFQVFLLLFRGVLGTLSGSKFGSIGGLFGHFGDLGLPLGPFGAFLALLGVMLWAIGAMLGLH